MLSKKLILSMAFATTLSTSAYAVNLSITAVDANNSGLILISGENEEAISEEAKAFIHTLATQGISFLENQTITEEQREKEFRSVLKNNFDMKTIGRFALGRYWRTSSDKQKKEYLGLFEEMVIDIYSRRFSEYNGEKFEVLSARIQGKSDAIVSSQIVPAGGAKVSVEWRVRKKKDGALKVIDIMVEGVSMSLTQRSDFASVIQRGGGNLDVLLAHLRPN